MSCVMDLNTEFSGWVGTYAVSHVSYTYVVCKHSTHMYKWDVQRQPYTIKSQSIDYWTEIL